MTAIAIALIVARFIVTVLLAVTIRNHNIFDGVLVRTVIMRVGRTMRCGNQG